MMKDDRLFPACAGVIPIDCPSPAFVHTFPRMRGGDPLRRKRMMLIDGFSPYARGGSYDR